MNNIREALYQDILPTSKTVQYVFSLITGKPHQGQVLPKRSPWDHLLLSSIALSTGIMLGIQAVNAGAWLLLPLSWLLTLHGARFWQLVIIHHCAHQNFIRHPKLDALLGWALSLLLLIEPFERYKHRHVRGHHARFSLSTRHDPSVQLLIRAGLANGLPVCVLQRRLLGALVSPRFHLYQFCERLRANITADVMTRIAFSIHLLALAGLAYYVGGTAFGLAVVLPLTVFYQQTQLIRICVEHLRAGDDATQRSQAQMAALTRAIFLGAAPPQDRSLPAWVIWFLKMLGHVLIRLVILPGESGAAHDYHHLRARGDWANYLQARRQHVAELEAQGKGHLYGEVWGLSQALRLSLTSISRLPAKPKAIMDVQAV